MMLFQKSKKEPIYAKIGVVGCRWFVNKEFVNMHFDRFLNTLQADKIIIVTGGAKGVDKLAVKLALSRRYGLEIFPPDWRRNGKRLMR